MFLEKHNESVCVVVWLGGLLLLGRTDKKIKCYQTTFLMT